MKACLQASALGLLSSLSLGGAARCKVSRRGAAGVGSNALDCEDGSAVVREEGPGKEAGVLRYVDWREAATRAEIV